MTNIDWRYSVKIKNKKIDVLNIISIKPNFLKRVQTFNIHIAL